jgi:hypothetical protein
MSYAYYWKTKPHSTEYSEQGLQDLIVEILFPKPSDVERVRATHFAREITRSFWSFSPAAGIASRFLPFILTCHVL